MPCLYLACHLRKGLIALFRLADLLALSRTAPYSRLLFGCRFCLIRAKQLPGPLAIGSVDPFLFGLQAGSQTCSGPLGGQRGPQEFPLSHKVTTLDLWNNQPLMSQIEQNQKPLRSSVSPILRENIYLQFLFTCISSILKRQMGGWPRLVGRGTIPAGPRELTAHPSLWVICQSAKLQVGASWLAS